MNGVREGYMRVIDCHGYYVGQYMCNSEHGQGRMFWGSSNEEGTVEEGLW